MRHPRPGRAIHHLVVTAALILAAGCGGGGDEAEPTTPSVVPTEPPSVVPTERASVTTSAQADEPIVLRIGTDDEPGVPAADQIEHFATEVTERSAGAIRIEPTWSAAGDGVEDWDQAVARMVMNGDLELGLVPARAWDALGVVTLRALHAPFLVTSVELLDAVVTDPVADDMLAGLEAAGVTGLGLVPEGLRRVFSFGEPFVAAAAFDGVTVRAPTSTTTNSALEALGATVDDFATPDGAFYDGVVNGTIAAAESSFAFADSLPRSTTAAGNLVLYPKANAFVANDDAFAALDDDQRRLLVDAAIATRGWAIAGNPAEADLAESFCAAGGTIVRADPGDVASIVAATEPVYATLAEDPATGELVDRIRALAAEVGPAVEIAPCLPPTDVEVPIPPAPTVPDGTDVSLVVESQIGGAMSPVSEAGGAFVGCTTIQDLDAEATEFNLDITIYSGTKQLSCSDGEVTVHYDVMTDERQPGITAGTWSIVSSTLAGVGSGGGQLNGDGRACEPAPGSDACIVDTFTGAVAP